MSLIPVWRRGPQHDRWDCTACSLALEEPPPRPQGFAVDQPDTRAKPWTPRGALNPEFDPTGAGPIKTSSGEEETA